MEKQEEFITVIWAILIIMALAVGGVLLGRSRESQEVVTSQAEIGREIVAGEPITTTISTVWEDYTARDAKIGAWQLSYELEVRPGGSADHIMRQTIPSSCQPAEEVPPITSTVCGPDLQTVWSTDLLPTGPYEVWVRMRWRNWSEDLTEYGRFSDAGGQDGRQYYLIDKFAVIEAAPEYLLYFPIIFKAYRR